MGNQIPEEDLRLFSKKLDENPLEWIKAKVARRLRSISAASYKWKAQIMKSTHKASFGTY